MINKGVKELLNSNLQCKKRNPHRPITDKPLTDSEIAAKSCIANWVNKEKVFKFYMNKPLFMVVDHVIPYKGKLVCGLHVENNLQYLSEDANRRKYINFVPYRENREGIYNAETDELIKRKPQRKKISRKEAIKQGLKYYYTGEPCPKCHVCRRFVSGSTCVKCNQESVRERQKKAHQTKLQNIDDMLSKLFGDF